VVSANRIEVTGVPIDPRFALEMPQAEARKALGLDPDPKRLTILLDLPFFGSSAAHHGEKRAFA
jgi:hypothetical protein